MLHINDLVFRFGGRMIFDGATAHLAEKQKVGLVGRNGSGKSTLFKLVIGDLAVDGGSHGIRPRARLGVVAQETPSGPTSLIDFVLAADIERATLLAEEETADPHHLGEIHERLGAIEAHSAPARAAEILSGLGFDEAAQNRPLSDFSGGWRMRVALAATLFSRPDLLLLDEPTNHLDLEASLWLEDYLIRFPGTLLIISHDRDLLDKTVGRIWHIDKTKIVVYAGNYTRFERTRRERLELSAKENAKQLEQRRHIEDFVARFRAKATKARQAQSRLKLLEKMDAPVNVVEERAISFDFPNPEPLSPPLISLEEVSVGYEAGKPVLNNLSLRIDGEDRIALLGANGNGKSTFAKLVAGRLTPMAGKLVRSGKLKIGFFAQHQEEELDLTATAYEILQRALPLLHEAKVRAHLGRFGFGQERANVAAAKLSGGEKARLLFALMSREAPHVMILDEPTNHLDIDSRAALVSALNAFEGAVLLISHDSRLIELCADRLWLVDSGRCQPYDGDLDDYRKLLLDRGRENRRGSKENIRSSAPSRKDERRAAAEQRGRFAHLRKAIQTAEKRLETLNGNEAKLEAFLADPDLYDKGADHMTSLTRELADVRRRITEAEEEWLAAQGVLEAAEKEA
jgi:ATP-binding cassette subfamily F protein 3